MVEFLIEITLGIRVSVLSDLFIRKPKIEIHIDEPEYEFLSWGDPIVDSTFRQRLKEKATPEIVINQLTGHYYYILLNKINGNIYAGNSVFSILPFYYFNDKRKIVISDNALVIGKYLKISLISNRFIIETLLFNYPLFNHSIFEDIKLLPSNSFIKLSNSRQENIKHTVIQDNFSESPKSFKKSVYEITELFLSKFRKYLPEENYVHSLTGGFDGRTLVATSLYYKKSFSCYSFGSRGSNDSRIALELSSLSRIPFNNIVLEDEYIKNESLPCGEGFILDSSGTATFARAHYLHAAKIIGNYNQYIITGNFGSEIFRAAHIAGAVISSNLYALFDSDSPEEGIHKVENSSEYKCLDGDYLKIQLESLKEDILHLPCYDISLSGLTKNQRFYVFVFEEIFRKYFGAEMINQFHYIKNRTPFLDMEFIKEIFKTRLAGIHSDFFEHNPFRRYKGQVLYAHIIRKTFPEFGIMITDKGYRPNDLLNPLGKLRIAFGYLKKRLGKRTNDNDPYAVKKAWINNRDAWMSTYITQDLFDLGKINTQNNQEILFKILSLSYLLKSIRR